MKKLFILIFLQLILVYAVSAGPVVRIHPSARPHVHKNIRVNEHVGENVRNDPNRKIDSRKTNADKWSGKTEKIQQERISDHLKRHQADFPNLKTEKAYVSAVKIFIKNPPKGTLSKIRASNGDLILYHPETNTFVSVSKNGAPKTMFKPEVGKHKFKTNLEYFYGQN